MWSHGPITRWLAATVVAGAQAWNLRQLAIVPPLESSYMPVMLSTGTFVAASASGEARNRSQWGPGSA